MGGNDDGADGRFNPRPRRGATAQKAGQGDGLAVSIHAPAGGATSHLCGACGGCGVSIHAPAGGATDQQEPVGVIPVVSIHAPAGGATRSYRVQVTYYSRFNPRPRRGGDFPSLSGRLANGGFNPRPRRGGDRRCGSSCRRCRPVSIHAPAGGATIACLLAIWLSIKFQSTPPQGGRRVAGKARTALGLFQSTPPQGGRLGIK